MQPNQIKQKTNRKRGRVLRERSGGGGGEDASSEEGRGARDYRVAEPRERHFRERKCPEREMKSFWLL